MTLPLDEPGDRFDVNIDPSGFQDAAFSASSRYLVAVSVGWSGPSTAYLFEGNQLVSVNRRATEDDATNVEFARDGRTVSVAEAAKTNSLEVPTLKRIRSAPNASATATSDSYPRLFRSEDRTQAFFETTIGKVALEKPGGLVGQDLSMLNKSLASAFCTSTLVIWDVHSGELLLRIAMDNSEQTTFTFRDGRIFHLRQDDNPGSFENVENDLKLSLRAVLAR